MRIFRGLSEDYLNPSSHNGWKMTEKPISKPQGFTITAFVSRFLLLLLLGAGCACAAEVDMAVISQIESSNNALAYNKHSKAVGLCQITPVVLREYDQTYKQRHVLKDLFDAEFNLLVAEWYMNHKIPAYLKHYHIKDTPNNRIFAYNAGILSVKRRNMPDETKSYIKKYNQLKRNF